MDLSKTPTFRPVQNPRSTEFRLWVLAILVWAAWLFLRSSGSFILVLTPVVGVVLGLLAAGNSLSNFIERRSHLSLSPAGVDFENGLRNASFRWADIQELRVMQTSLGAQQVYVSASEARFSFKTLGVARHKDKELGRSGFPEGERIVEVIISQAGLARRDTEDSGVYYARK